MEDYLFLEGRFVPRRRWPVMLLIRPKRPAAAKNF